MIIVTLYGFKKNGQIVKRFLYIDSIIDHKKVLCDEVVIFCDCFVFSIIPFNYLWKVYALSHELKIKLPKKHFQETCIMASKNFCQEVCSDNCSFFTNL